MLKTALGTKEKKYLWAAEIQGLSGSNQIVETVTVEVD